MMAVMLLPVPALTVMAALSVLLARAMDTAVRGSGDVAASTLDVKELHDCQTVAAAAEWPTRRVLETCVCCAITCATVTLTLPVDATLTGTTLDTEAALYVITLVALPTSDPAVSHNALRLCPPSVAFTVTPVLESHKVNCPTEPPTRLFTLASRIPPTPFDPTIVTLIEPVQAVLTTTRLLGVGPSIVIDAVKLFFRNPVVTLAMRIGHRPAIVFVTVELSENQWVVELVLPDIRV